MKRRTYLASICSAGIMATSGCNTIAGNQTLSDPTVHTESPGKKGLIFTSNDEEVGDFGVDGSVVSNRIDLSTEIPHRDGTNIKSIKLRIWMPEIATESPAKVAVISPVEGDSSPPPSLSLYTPDQALGTVIEITDLDDLADETISTLDLIVIPESETATQLNIHVTIDLAGSEFLSSDYTLDGELQLEYPELAN
ncbi:hypothetical protein ACFR9U_14540 [Halorientalis brevis]|uniref:DUF8121 domain-containing protein n=1 Tax=Halorientalis brevis TaxID=1126241 RepID=A0ABD6CCY2_9EURY|nr:hypothetical protein [Halorientalis brevis]